MAERVLRVKIVGDEKDLRRAFTSSARGAKTFDRDLGRASRGALAGSGALQGLGKSLAFASGSFISAAAAIGLVRAAFTELRESNKVAAQTAAVIKSTGGIAGVTAKHVEELGRQLLRKTSIDDEAIKSAANLLLTFTNVRNVVGEGNNIFDRATQTVLDMSVALGQDAKASAIALGKALQDPVRGVTALRRVGVSFTKQQQAQIKTLADSGRVMQALKLILRELATEFGGSAAAAGKADGGLVLLKETIVNLSAEIVEKFLPNIIEAADRAQKWLDNPANTAPIVKGAEDTAKAIGEAGRTFDEWNTKVKNATESVETTLSTAAQATRVAFLEPLSRLPGDLGDIFEEAQRESLEKLRRLRRGAVSIAIDMSRELTEALQLKGRQPLEATGADPPGTVPSPLRAGITRAQRNAWFDAIVGRRLNRVQDVQALQGQVNALARVAELVRERLAHTQDITRRLKLEDQLLDIGRQQRGLREQIAANQIEARRLALEKSRERIALALEQTKRRQFLALGLGPTGDERVPGVTNLRRQLGNVSEAIEGTFLDTTKTESILARVRKVLAGGLGKVSEDVRSTIRDMLRDINQQLRDHTRQQTKFRALDTSKFLAGIPGLTADQKRALRGRLSQIGVGGTVPTRGAGAFGIGFATAGGGGNIILSGPLTVKADNPNTFLRELQKTAQRTPAQRGGRAGGRAMGLA